MIIIMNYLPKSNGKDNYLKSRLCLSCKNVEMSLRSFWHNTVDVGGPKNFGTLGHRSFGMGLAEPIETTPLPQIYDTKFGRSR